MHLCIHCDLTICRDQAHIGRRVNTCARELRGGSEGSDLSGESGEGRRNEARAKHAKAAPVIQSGTLESRATSILGVKKVSDILRADQPALSASKALLSSSVFK